MVTGVLIYSMIFQVPEFTADLMLLTAVFNSCFNPLVYGAHFYKDFRTLGRSRNTTRLCSVIH